MNKEEIGNTFLQAISASFKAYNKHGARSNKKLIPIHSWFAKTINKNTEKSYTVMSLGSGKKGKEYQLEGKYFPKTLDITIFCEQKPIITVSFKFATSNYKQNSNNYFENLLGETANIRRVNVAFTHFLVLRAKTPYYKKEKGNKRGKQKGVEIINEQDLSKYVKLFKDQDFPHKPDLLGMAILDFDKKGEASFADLGKMNLGKNTIELLNNQFAIDKFIEKIIALCRFKS